MERKIGILFVTLVVLLMVAVPVLAAGNPHGDGDCQTIVTDPNSGAEGTRAEIYNCKPIGNSGEEQGIYNLYDILDEEHGTCDYLVKWSGDFGGDPYLDYGRVFNRISCSDGYVEVWGDRFGPEDSYGATPYVYSIKGEGTQLHGPE